MAIYKHNPNDYIWWRSEDFPGSLEFSFDKKTWNEYPYEFKRLTEEQNPNRNNNICWTLVCIRWTS